MSCNMHQIFDIAEHRLSPEIITEKEIFTEWETDKQIYPRARGYKPWYILQGKRVCSLILGVSN